MSLHSLDAPAKLNLSLRVLAKREDGFHEIDSLMVSLPGLADRLIVSPSEADGFTCDDPTVPADSGNLVLKAVTAYREVTGFSQPLSIHLEKRVPHGAGLGGGSSDAATMLSAINRLNGDALTTEALMGIAATIGSDIPFFLGTPVARAKGRGEIIEPAAPLPQLPVLLLKPSFGVPTPDAYKNWTSSKELPGVSYVPQVFSWGELVNDLERPVFAKFYFLAEMKVWLLGRKGVAGALMSGSGSTMFAILEDPEAAETIVTAARQELDPTLWAWHGTVGG
jgi:4-diphosphocytidyl-2-C-methyl-D-erythritol kinase